MQESVVLLVSPVVRSSFDYSKYSKVSLRMRFVFLSCHFFMFIMLYQQKTIILCGVEDKILNKLIN